MTNNIYGIILAGGSGARLWPLSRELYPKQLLKFNGEDTLFQVAFTSLIELIDDKNIISVTNSNLETTVRMQLEQLRQKFCRTVEYKILTEPVGRGTAAAVAFSAKYVLEAEGKQDAILTVIPTDCFIKDKVAYTEALEKAFALAKENKIALIGAKPESADPGLGYIKAKENPKISKIVSSALEVCDFCEKPTNPKKYLKMSNAFCSTGIWVAKAKVFLEEIAKYEPSIFEILNKVKLTKKAFNIDYTIFKDLPALSFDHAVLEQSENLVVVPLACKWNDLGAWDRIYDNLPKDANKNAVIGYVDQTDCKNSMFYSTSKLVAAIGVKDTIVVETPDAVLVCAKNKVQCVRDLYQKLKQKNESTYREHKTVYRPWGYYTIIDQGKGFITKRIVVNPGGKLSIQRHKHRSEHWVVLDGQAKVILGNKELCLQSGQCVDIGIMEIHSLQNPFEGNLTILEVQKGDILDENDIERLQDIYGRV